MHKPIVERRGYFISGKFDQYKQNIPYASLVQALEMLVRQILMEDAEKISNWKNTLLAVLGANAGIMTEVTPSFEYILGPQPKPGTLGPIETQNRFKQVFMRFIQALATPAHPLVIFLDDLQWAYPSSLQLIHSLLTHPDTKCLLIIGSYRDNEVTPTHLLSLELDELKKAGVNFETLVLSPLSSEEVGHLLRDTLHTDQEETQPLTDLCYAKTNGNPFFLNQLLQSLYQEKLIYLNDAHDRWTWNLQQIYQIGVSENVVDLMVDKIKKLNENTQQLLQLAACVGYRFGLKTLSMVYGKPLKETASNLWEVLQEGLVIPEDESYKFVRVTDDIDLSMSKDVPYRFLHDRVQQAAYSIIPENKREGIHLQIGELLLANTTNDNLEDSIFDIVNQLNAGQRLIVAAEKRWRLARLNFLAGKKAKDATAFTSAVNYLQIAKASLPTTCWEENHDLSAEILSLLAECLYFTSNFSEADLLIHKLLNEAKTDLEKANIYILQISLYKCAGKLPESIDVGIKAFKLFGTGIHRHPSKLSILKEEIILKRNLGKRSISSLLNQPLITDPTVNSLLLLANLVRPAAYLTGQRNLWIMLVLKAVNLALRHGSSPEVANTYMGYSVYLNLMDRFQEAYEFAKLAIELNAKLDDLQYRCATLAGFTVTCHHWNEPWQTR